MRKAGSDIGGDEIRAHLTKHVAKWWLPDEILFVDSLPHTATGKLLKIALREQYRDYQAADRPGAGGAGAARASRASARRQSGERR